MKTTKKKLSLSRETLRSLDSANLGRVGGAVQSDIWHPCVVTYNCITPDCDTLVSMSCKWTACQSAFCVK